MKEHISAVFEQHSSFKKEWIAPSMAVTPLCKNTLYGLPELQQGLFLSSSWQSSK